MPKQETCKSCGRIIQLETGKAGFGPPQPIGVASKRAMNSHKRARREVR